MRTSRKSCSMRLRLNAPAPPVRSMARSTMANAWSITNDRVATSRTGQSACSTPAAQSAQVRSSIASAAS